MVINETVMLNVCKKQQLERATKRKGQEENESSKSQMLNTIDKRPIRQPSGKH